MLKRKIDIRKFFVRLILIVLLISAIGLYFANKFVKKYDYDNIGDFISNYYHNKQLAKEVEPKRIDISVSDKDYDFLKRKRQEALDRGIQINIGDNYVDCDVKVGDKKIKAEVRLKGHMTDHLQGDKWSFRVKSDEPIMGMYRFSLQHPGTRGYAYEWIYHQLLKQENIIYLNYDFVHLNFKGKDLGIYALEEHFGQHLPARINRPKGAILRWNPGLYWEWRIDAMQDIWLDESYSSYSSTFAEPYDRGTVKDDPELIETYLRGAKLLEAWRRDSLKTSEVFDVEKMARFHAVIDLVGGHHSLDWSDVKFFYNSETERIEPVGYESFSIRKSERIAGQRSPDYIEGIEEDYHNKLFDDPVFFEAYIQNLERIADENYVHNFKNSIQKELDKKIGIIAHEWPYRKFSFDGYFENVDLIRHNLELPKPFHAFIDAHTDSTVQLSFAPVSDFPIQITEVEFDGDEKVQVDSFYLPPKPRKTFTRYYTLILKHDDFKVNNLLITAKIPGSKNSFEIMAAEYPAFTFAERSSDSASLDLKNHHQSMIDNHQILIKGQELIIDKPYQLAEDYSLKILPGQHLVFKDNGKIIAKGRIDAIGDSEHPIQIDNNTQGICISLKENKTYNFAHVVFTSKGDLFNSSASTVLFQNCVFADIDKCVLKAQKSKIDLKDCQMASVHSFANLNQCEMKLYRVNGKKMSQFAALNASYISSRSCHFDEYEQLFQLKHISTVDLGATEISNTTTVAQLQDASLISLLGGKLREIKTAFVIKTQDADKGESSYSLYKTDQNAVGTLSSTSVL